MPALSEWYPIGAIRRCSVLLATSRGCRACVEWICSVKIKASFLGNAKHYIRVGKTTELLSSVAHVKVLV